MTRAERNIRWIEAHIHLPAGKNVGKPIRLAEFMKADLKEIYDNPRATTRRAIISRGRKNAKTTSCAILVLLICAGPSIESTAKRIALRSRASRLACCSISQPRLSAYRRSFKA